MFSGKGYQEAIEEDLSGCNASMVLASAWVGYARARQLGALLKDAVRRGVEVNVVLREPAKPTEEWEKVLGLLEELGCRVRVMPRKGPALDYAVLDDALV